MPKVILISFDAVGDAEFDILMKYPHFNCLARQSTVVRKVQSVFLSNTYPIHSSIATGVPPEQHGIISNMEPFPKKHRSWLSSASRFRVEALWQAAAKKGLTTAAVFWPVTAGAKEIRYNIPEVLAKPGESQLLTSLKAGSKRLQLYSFLRHRKILSGISQPNLDGFATACMVDIIPKHQPDLMLLHLTCYDSLCHQYGRNAKELTTAYESLDRNLGALLNALDRDTTVIVFSDHSQLNCHTILCPNDWLAEKGYLIKNGSEYAAASYGCYIDCCGGSAFFYGGNLAETDLRQMRNLIEKSQGFNRFLTEEEMKISGRKDYSFGFASKEGYCYETCPSDEKANHGYPLDYKNYRVFYLIRRQGDKTNRTLEGGSILQITDLINAELNLEMSDITPCHPEIFLQSIKGEIL